AIAVTAAACSGASSSPESTSSDDESLRKGNGIAEILVQKNLASDVLPAKQPPNPDLKNTWGLAFTPTGVAWIADNATDKASILNQDGSIRAPSVDVASAPTGIVFNGDDNAFRGKRFIFVTEEGTVLAWAPADDGAAQQVVPPTGAIYKG